MMASSRAGIAKFLAYIDGLYVCFQSAQFYRLSFRLMELAIVPLDVSPQ